MHNHTHTIRHTHTHNHTHKHIHTRIHTHTHAHTHMHTQLAKWFFWGGRGQEPNNIFNIFLWGQQSHAPRFSIAGYSFILRQVKRNWILPLSIWLIYSFHYWVRTTFDCFTTTQCNDWKGQTCIRSDTPTLPGMRVAVVLAVVLFLVKSVICVLSRGCRSEVMTTPYHFCSDLFYGGVLQEWICSLLFPRYSSCKRNTYRYSVQLGTFSIGRTIFWVAFGYFIVVLAWQCSHVISSIAKLNGSLQGWLTASCLLSFQEHNWGICRSDHITWKGILRSITRYTKERLFPNKKRQEEQNAFD